MSDRIDRGPTRFGSRLAVVLAALAVLAATLTSWQRMVTGAVGAVVFGLGIVRGSRKWSTIGTLGISGGLIVGAVSGAPVEPVLVGVVWSVVAWDVGEHAISLGEQVGAETTTVRNELAHFLASSTVGVGGAAVGYVVFRTVTGGRPTAALVLLLFGVIVLLTALRFVQPSTPTGNRGGRRTRAGGDAASSNSTGK